MLNKCRVKQTDKHRGTLAAVSILFIRKIADSSY
jgi:hypothetical protein